MIRKSPAELQDVFKSNRYSLGLAEAYFQKQVSLEIPSVIYTLICKGDGLLCFLAKSWWRLSNWLNMSLQKMADRPGQASTESNSGTQRATWVFDAWGNRREQAKEATKHKLIVYLKILLKDSFRRSKNYSEKYIIKATLIT